MMVNLAYCTNLNGAMKQYLTKFHRYLRLSKSIERKVLNGFGEIISKVNPDLILLVEVKKKQFNKLNNNEYLDNEEYSVNHSENKYGSKSMLRNFFYFKDNCNAFISKEKLQFKKYFLKNGTKKLVYELVLPDGTLLVFAHFSLSKKTRQKQFAELNSRYHENCRIILCGDFNTKNKDEELLELTNNLKLNIYPEEPTFPAISQKKFFDLFLCSLPLNIRVKTIKTGISDHLPVLLSLYGSKTKK